MEPRLSTLDLSPGPPDLFWAENAREDHFALGGSGIDVS